jgi:hypothetical protein
LQRVKDSKGRDTGTRLEHLQAVARITGNKPAELDYPQPVEDMQYIMGHFNRVKRMRGEPITYSELQAYCTMTATTLAAWEVDAIMQVDAIFERSLNV